MRRICPRQPLSSAIASTRVERNLTMANSAATKKPLSKTRIKAKRIMPKSAKSVARVKPGEGSMMEFYGFRRYR